MSKTSKVSLDRLAGALFRPDGVALIGASDDPAKNTGRPQRYLAKHGFAGSVAPINARRDLVQEVPAFPDLATAPDTIDHAFVMVPAPAVPEVIRQCADKGVAVATIYSDGFAESGADGLERQREIVAIAGAGGVRLIGPNSMGVISPANRVALSVNAVLEMERLVPGRIGVVSQSGTILGTLISRGAARGIGFSHMVSVGNECDLGVGEIVDLLAGDPDTDVIALFLEGVRDAEALGEAARRAHEAGKPVIAHKLGRSKAGRQLAQSHSGAIAGGDRSVGAFFRHHGILRADMLETLFEMPALVAGRRPGRGRRVSVVTTTGGGAATVADRLGALGLDLVGPGKVLRERLSALGVDLGGGPLVDLTMAGTRKEVYAAALETLLAGDDCDAVVAVVGSSGQFHPELAVAPIVEADTGAKFLAAFIAPDAPESLRRLTAAGKACFRTPEACADAVHAALTWRPPVDIAATKAPDIGEMSRDNATDERGASRVFAALGVEQTRSVVLPNADDPVPADLPYPVAVKVLSPDIAHKADVGGIRLGVGNVDEVRGAVADIRAAVGETAPQARITGYLVQAMETGQQEVLVGFRRDPEVGPVAIVGAGGVLTEIYEDVAVRLAPVDVAMAREMIDEVKGLAPLRGYRGAPQGDLDALARAIAALSTLALAEPPVAEAEINPLLVRREGEGVVAVDGLIRLA